MDHLNLLRSNDLQIKSPHDGGLSDVLQSFAKSLGCEITNEPLSEEARHQGVRGQIFYTKRPVIIYYQPTQDRVDLADTLAHELAHLYDYNLMAFEPLHVLDEDVNEQIAEAVASAVLYDYGVNRVALAREYIRSFTPKERLIVDFIPLGGYRKRFYRHQGFDDGVLDKPIETVYTRLSLDLEAFLREV